MAELGWFQSQRTELIDGEIVYWIINLVDSQLEVYRAPTPDPTRPYGWGYSRQTILQAGAIVAPLGAPSIQIPVEELLP